MADGSIRWELDDGEHPRGTPKHADDIFVTIYYKDGMPYKAIKPKENATSSANEYTYQFIVNEKIICDDWTPEPVGKEFNIPGSSSLTDYGLSKGTYKVLAGKVNRVDPAQFLILDYPKPIADYNDELGDNDTWDQFFITDPVQWEKTRKNGGFMWVDPSAAWQFYQALRHFGKANVLFCDGSVKALGPEDLFVTNPAWYYAGP